MSRRKDGSAGGFVAYADVLFNAFFFVFGMFVLQSLLPHLKAQEEAAREGISPGKMCIQLFWNDSLNVDIDLIGRSPDGKIAMYSNKSVPMMDLLRDDLGTYNDPSGKNFETICSRVLAAGAWTWNAHYYANHESGDEPDIALTLIVSFPQGGDSVRSQPPIKVTGNLHQVGDEVTVLDFELDSSGKIIPNTINTVQQPLRSLGVGK